MNEPKKGGFPNNLVKEQDILDPESKPKDPNKSHKGIGDVAKDLKDKAESTGKNIKRVASALKALGPYGCIALLIIIVIIGFISFIWNMPGLTIEKLKQIASECVEFIQSLFLNGADAKTNDEDVIRVAQYLEEMNYNLIDYGFVRPVVNTEGEETILTYQDLIDNGYSHYEQKNGDEAPRYYNDNDEPYDGYYYNSVGIKINNETGKADDNKYEDKYGIWRSTEETNEDGTGKVVGLYRDKADLLWTYLLSDNRIYTLKNDDESFLKDAFAGLQKIFGGAKANWAKGLIKLYNAQNGIATESWGNWVDFVMGEAAKIDRSSNTLRIKKGWGNGYMSFDMTGWAPRYGLSLEFLLSLHIGTMAPDLVYAVVQNFDTEIQVYLDDAGGSEVAARYVDPYSGASGADMGFEMSDVKEAISNMEGLTDGAAAAAINSSSLGDWINGSLLTKRRCQKLLTYGKSDEDEPLSSGREINLASPDNCTGAYQQYVVLDTTSDVEKLFGIIDVSNSPLKSYGIDDEEIDTTEQDFFNYTVTTSDNKKIDNFDAAHCAKSVGVPTDPEQYEIFKGDSAYWLRPGSDTGYNEQTAHVSEPTITEEETKFEVDNIDSSIDIWNYSYKKVKTITTWTSIVDDEEVQFTWVKYKYLIYDDGHVTRMLKADGTGYQDVSDSTSEQEAKTEDERWIDTIIWEYIIRDKSTTELINDGVMDEEGNMSTDANKCSNNPNQTRCCKSCQEYVKKVIAALANVEDQKFSAYTPYIARVVGSWFRDTYFVIPNAPDQAISEYMDGVSGEKEVKDSNGNSAGTRTSYSPGHTDSMIANAYSENSELVNVDQDYLADAKEYWTEYERNNQTGDYQLFYLNPDGTTSDIKAEEWLEDNGYGSILDSEGVDAAIEKAVQDAEDDPNKDAIAFVKKAKTTKVTDLEKIEDEDSDEERQKVDGVLWSAYDFKSEGSSTGWTRVSRKDAETDGNEDVIKLYDAAKIDMPSEDDEEDGDGGGDSGEDDEDEYDEDPDLGIFYNIETTNTVEQIEDAQRSQTNPIIKRLFKYRRFYIYDGTESRAIAIEEDRQYVLKAVWDFLKSEYGGNWTQQVSGFLSKYGRSALRQGYRDGIVVMKTEWDVVAALAKGKSVDEAIFGLSDDQIDLIEAWLEWQLDMYYSKLVPTGYSGYLLDDDQEWQIEDKDGNVETRYGDPRNKDLIYTVNITKSSLNAFAILENMHTIDAEYQYRDFKELIVELDYFDKEDLSGKAKEVMTWIMPDSGPIGWPVRPHDKQNLEYGTLVQSKATYAYLNGTTASDTDVGTEDEANTGTDTENNTGENTNNTTTDNTTADNTTTDNSTNTDTSTTDTNTDTSAENNTEETKTIDKSKIYFIGDSWINALNGRSFLETSYIDGVDGARAGDSNMNASAIPYKGDASCLVLHLGMNQCTSQSMTNLIDNLQSRYNKIPIYVVGVLHVASNYSGDGGPASARNTQIDTYNSEVKSYCDGKDNVYYIDVSSGLVGSDGYLTDSSGYGGYHLGTNASYETWYNNIISGIEKSNVSSSETENVEVEVYDGYEEDTFVVSPVTGKVLEYGTHKRVNVYTNEEEEVGYIIIEPMTEEYFEENMVINHTVEGTISTSSDGNSDQNSSSGNTTGNTVSNTSSGSSDDEDKELTDKEIADALNLFFREYDGVCAGYTIMIDGFDVDLGLTDDNGKNGKYQKNKVMALYNTEEKEKREKQEEQKEKAPFLVNFGESDSFPEEYIAEVGSKKGYYVKEGKYIGKTVENYVGDGVEGEETEDIEDIDENIVDEENVDDNENENASSGISVHYSAPNEVGDNATDDENTDADDESSEETTTGSSYDIKPHDGPADYMRILIKDTDFAIVENVEDYITKPDVKKVVDQVSQEYQPWEGDLELLAETISHESPVKWNMIHAKGDEELGKFNSYCMGYSIVNKLLECNRDTWYGNLYDLSRTDMSPLAQVVTSSWYGCRDEMRAYINGAAPQYTQEDLEIAEFCLTYDCTSVVKPKDDVLSDYAISHGYTTLPAGSVIPRVMMQQGGLGDNAPGQDDIILVGYVDYAGSDGDIHYTDSSHDDNVFGKGDELFGVDRVLENRIEE